MIDVGRIRHKGLKLFWAKGDASKLRPDWLKRIRWALTLMHAATEPEALNVPGLSWHVLEGDRSGTFSVRVNRNWRLTYRWDSDGPYDIDLEDYHGK